MNILKIALDLAPRVELDSHVDAEYRNIFVIESISMVVAKFIDFSRTSHINAVTDMMLSFQYLSSYRSKT